MSRALPLFAIGVGEAAIGVSYAGTGSRPLVGAFVLALVAAAALAPLRLAIPAALGLAAFDGLILDVLGAPARYWKEAFVGCLVARALWARPPTLRVLAAGTAAAAAYGAYWAGPASFAGVAWAAKLLLLALVAWWALARLRPDDRVWRAAYGVLAVGAGANAALALWQTLFGRDRLLELGFAYGERVRETGSGDLRAFGGFTSSAGLSFFLALVLLAWLGTTVAARPRSRLVLATAWVPAACVLGLALSHERVALLALGAAVVGVAVAHARRLVLAAAAVAVVTLAAVLAAGGVDLLARALWVDPESAETHAVVWEEWAEELSVAGAGPGAAGAAYRRTKPDRTLPVEFLGWHMLERPGHGEPPFRWMATEATLAVGGPLRERPPAILRLDASSYRVERALRFGRDWPGLGARLVPVDRYRRLWLRLPRGSTRLLLLLTARPPAYPARLVSPGDSRLLAVRAANVLAWTPGHPPPTLAERVSERARARRPERRARPGTAPGAVDNQYLSWLVQYGLLGGTLLCGAWLALLLRPLVRPLPATPLVLTARFWGLFAAAAAAFANLWEEAPVDFVLALVLAQLVGSVARRDAPTRPRVCAVVVNWNGLDDTRVCLESLRRSEERAAVVVVDNGSTDGSADAIAAEYRDVELLRSARNLGFAGGNNLGIRSALERGYEHILLLNNDAAVEPATIGALLAAARDRVGIVGAALDEPDGVTIGGGRIDRWTFTSAPVRDPRETPDYVSGACMLVRREVFEQVGLFDERYFFYFEDADLCLRARAAGWELAVAPGARVRHRLGATVSRGSSGRSARADELQAEAGGVFIARHGGRRAPLALGLRLAGIAAKRLARRQPGRIVPVSRALLRGWKAGAASG